MTSPTHTTGSIAAHLGERMGNAHGGVELIGRPDLTVTHLNTLDRASEGALTFIRTAWFGAGWKSSAATAALVSRGIVPEGHDPGSRALIMVPDADLALNLVLELMAPRVPARTVGVHPAAFVDPRATLGAGVSVGPGCTVEAGATVGDGSVLIATAYVGRDVRIGRACTLYPGVCVLDRCVLGDGCTLHSGVVVGADGFGYRPSPDGRGVVKIPHIGNVEIGRGVEIGANSCIDRAKFGATVIGDGTKIDNLVQIGHGCRIGRSCLICGGVGLAGSVEVGDGAMFGGQAGVADGLKIGERAMVAAQSGIMKDVPAGESWFGTPAAPLVEHFRDQATLRKLAKHIQELRSKGIDPFAMLTRESRARRHAPKAEP